MIHYILREIGARAALAALRALADANAGRGFDPWAGEPMLPAYLAERPEDPTTTDLYPTMSLPLYRPVRTT